MPDQPLPTSGLTIQNSEHSGQQESGGNPDAVLSENPLTQAGHAASQMPTNQAPVDPLQPDKALMTGLDGQGKAVDVESDQAKSGGQVTAETKSALQKDHDSTEKAKGHPAKDGTSPAKSGVQGEAVPQDEDQPSGGDDTQDEFGKDPNDKDQPKSEAPPPVKPPVTMSMEDLPSKLVTNKDLVHGQDAELNKHRV